MKTKEILNKTLFVGDKSQWSRAAAEVIKEYSSECEIVLWEPGEKKPELLFNWEGNWIFSFKSDLILPQSVLDRASDGKINFHPSPPQYRGIGGYTYAIMNNDENFGITVHHMVKKIDFGEIIKVFRFPILMSENSNSLKMRSGAYCLCLFYEIVGQILQNMELAKSSESWHDKLYTRKELKNMKTPVAI